MTRIISCMLACGLLLAVAAQAAPATATDGRADIEFITTPAGGKFQPKHVLAVWVADAQTNFVATVLKRATKRQKYLFTWNQARGTNDSPDAVTGPTRLLHEPVKASWSGRTSGGAPAPDGRYFFMVEFTDQHAQGPLGCFPFSKGPAPASETFKDTDHLKQVRVRFQPGSQP
jgi:hypothetical protein